VLGDHPYTIGVALASRAPKRASRKRRLASNRSAS
jgi:hypothetical protein